MRRLHQISEHSHSEACLCQDFRISLVQLRSFLCLLHGTHSGLLLGIESTRLHLALLLEASDQVLVRPAVLVREISKPAELALGADAQDLEATRDHHALLAVIRMRNALEGFEPVKCGGSARRLVGNHAADGAPEDLGRRPVVKWAMLWVRVHLLAPELGKLELVAEEGARDVNVFRAHADDLLSIEKFFGQCRREAPQEVAPAINDNLCLERHAFGITHAPFPRAGSERA